MQAWALPSENVPAGQGKHEELPAALEKFPAGHDSHASSEARLLYVPAGHSSHLDCEASKRWPCPQTHSSPTRSKDGSQTQSVISGYRGKSMEESCDEKGGQSSEQVVP